MTSALDLHDGYAPRQLADIQQAMNIALAAIVDPTTGERPFQNATDDTMLQQIVAIFAEAVAQVENAAKIAFDQRDPLTATGAGESALVQLNGIVRKPGAASILRVRLSGRPGTVITAGAAIGTPDGGNQFRIDAEAVIAADGTVEATATCTTKGPANPDPGQV